MELNELVDLMTVDIYQRLLTAVELGKWPDGVALTPEQKENSLQAVMLWQAKHNHNAQHMTVGTDGNITLKTKNELKSLFESEKR
ncbi:MULTISPECIES: YeaC family protein [Arsenophonus]|jgi:uncharacterized protein|uniref:YeaC family protein n=1 Tax=Arsenophonus TaxID=637 RepID=UPI0015D94D8E|nr:MULTISPECIES: DUF1315 family protein [Arsenophonus]UBX30432.1 DUF1315 family protein [Arsenophonus apicola]